MKKVLILAMSIGAATTAFAHDGVKDPTVMARMMLMEDIRDATGVLGGMARGKIGFDAEKAAGAKVSLEASSAKVIAAFIDNATDPKSEALPAIWTSFDDFTVKAQAMEAAAGAIDVSSLDTLKAGIGDIGKTCGGCHKAYRQ